MLNAAVTTLIEDLPQAETPQQILDLLWDALPAGSLSVSTLWLYQPLGQYVTDITYIEQVGCCFAQDKPKQPERLPLDPTHPTVERLLAGAAVSPGTFDAPDALLQALVESVSLADWRVLPLRTAERAVGCLFIGVASGDLTEMDVLPMLRPVLPIAALNLTVQRLEYERSVSQYERSALLDAVNDAVLITRTTAGRLPVLHLNGRFQYLFNVGDGLVGESLATLLEHIQVPVNTRQRLQAMLQRVSKHIVAVDSGEFEMVTQAGQPVEIHWYTTPLINPEDGQVFARLFIFHDVTPERAAVQVRSAFLSRVSHELRTPLTAISGFAEFILEEVGEDLPLLAYEYTEIIHASAQKLKHIFTDLIEMTRAYSGEVQLTVRQVDVQEILQSVIKEQMSLLDTHNQTVQVNAPDNLPDVHMDTERMSRVFKSVLSNASHYAPADSRIRVELFRVNGPDELPKSTPKDIMLPALMVRVMDEGDGILPEETEHIFEPFYRARSAWKLYSDGIGLGLAVSRSIVDVHRGKIWAHPADDNVTGGCVYVALPLNPDALTLD